MTQAEQSPAFTASRIADLLGQDRKTVREQLDPGQARHALCRGQSTHAWPFEVLPTALRTRLESLAHAQGYKDVSRFLEKGRVRWQPAIPLGKIAAAQIERAQRRCAAIAPVLGAHRAAPIAEIVSFAQTAWRNVVGYNHTSDRTMRRWIERALQRDCGFEDWDRWAIYLDDDVIATPTGKPSEAAAVFQTPHLEAAIESIADPARPTADEREYVWLKAMEEADSLALQGCASETLQKLILCVLMQSGVPLALTSDALRVAFRRKRAQWLAAGGTPSAIADKRAERNASRRWRLPDPDRLLLLRYYLKSGDLASAFRLAVKNRVLTPETLTRFAVEPRDKSHVPHSVRAALASDIKLIEQRKQGPRAARLNGGWIERDPTTSEPGDWWQADDLTPPVYFWDETAAPFFFGRGQVLMMIDVRTMCVLGWVLISARNYNARAIRSLITHCHDVHGLPRHGFYFERGIWESARILKGAVPKGDTQVDFQTTELGLREFGLHFEHANTPGAKVIERVFGLLQNRMEAVPGYCGRDERRDCPESVARQIREVTAGRAHPSAYFLSKQQWAEEVDRIIADYNAERHGIRAKYIPGQSPREAYAARRTDDVMRLPPESRYILAHHRLTRTVQRNGIKLPPGLGGGLYRGTATGPILGQEVLAWVDPDHLDSITITDLDRTNPRIVERADAPPMFADDPSDVRAAMDNLASHGNYGANLFRVVSAANKAEGFRRVVIDAQTQQVGAEMARQATAREAHLRTNAANRRFVQTEAAKLGLAIQPAEDARQLARQRQGAELIKAALEEMETQDQDAGEDNIPPS